MRVSVLSKLIKMRFAQFMEVLHNRNATTNFSYVRNKQTIEVVWTQHHSSLDLNWTRPNKLHQAYGGNR